MNGWYREMKNIDNIYRNHGINILKCCNGVVGHLVPCMENGRMVERSFIRHSNPGNKTRPFAWIGVDYMTGVFLYYKHCMAEDFMDTKQYPADTCISDSFLTMRTAKEQEEMEQKLWELYKQVRELVFRDNLSELQEALICEYKKQWKLTVLTDLQPYYEALSPEFFQWLGRFE